MKLAALRLPNPATIRAALRRAGAALGPLLRSLPPAFNQFTRGSDVSVPAGAARWLSWAPRIALLLLAVLALCFAIGPHLLPWIPEIAVRSQIEWGWPVLAVLLCALAAPLLGAIRHGFTGRSFLFPSSILLCAFAVLFAMGWIIGWWAVDWLRIGVLAWLVAFAVMALALAFALVAGIELWRLLANDLVCEQVRTEVAGGRFVSPVPERSRWGSPHALRVVQGIWDLERHEVIAELCVAPASRTVSAERSLIFRRAAEALLHCLRLEWPPEFWPAGEQARRSAEVQLHRLTLAAVCPGLAVQDGHDLYSQWSHDYRDAAFETAGEEGRDATRRFVDALLEFLSWARGGHPSAARQIIQRSQALFANLEGHAREVFAFTWLAVVPSGSDADLGADEIVRMWERFASVLGGGLFPPDPTNVPARENIQHAQRSLPCDPAPALAIVRLAEHYAGWRSLQPSAASEDFTGRAERSAGLAHHVVSIIRARLADTRAVRVDEIAPRGDFRARLTAFLARLSNFREWLATVRNPAEGRGILATAHADASRVSSWIYREVRMVWQVRWTFSAIAIVFFLLTAGALCLLCPRVPINAILGLNRIDRVEDRRFGGGFVAPGEARVLSRSREYLALGTADGLYLMHEASRTHFGRQLGGNIRDLAENRVGDGLLALRDGADITDVRKEWSGFSATPWLSAPAQPVWKGARRAPALAAGFADQRCVFALQGQGIAAYSLPAGMGWHGSWTVGDYGNAPLTAAWMAPDRVYLQINNRVACVDRATLSRLDRFEFSADQPPLAGQVKSFHFGTDDPWASLVETNGRLWLQAAAGGWSGPFLGGNSALASASDVTFARLGDSVAWLATPTAVHAYDLERRVLRTVIQAGSITGLEPIPGTARALVSTAQGLFRIYGLNPDTENTVTLESQPVRELSLSADGRTCVYRLAAPQAGDANTTSGKFQHAPDGESVCVRFAPFSSSIASSIVLPEKAWRATPDDASPEITGVVSWRDKLIFTTNNGGFLYNPAQHTYADSSSVVRFVRDDDKKTTDTQVQTVTAFSATAPGTDVMTIAGGHPAVYRESVANKSNTWLDLDPNGRTANPVLGKEVNAVAAAGGSFFGAAPEGFIHRYPADGSGWNIASFCTGRIAPLDLIPPDLRTFKGDISPQPTDPLLGFIAADRVIIYDTASAALSEDTPPDVPLATIRQLLVESRHRLFLLGNQRFAFRGAQLGTLPSKVFGRGALAFPPREISAVGASGFDQIAVAGGGGSVMRYGWEQAEWVAIGGGRCPLAPDDVIDEVRGSGDFTFVNTRNGRPQVAVRGATSGDQWHALSGFRVAVPQTGLNTADFFLLNSTGLVRVTPSIVNGVSEWTRKMISSGEGAQAFVEAADALWCPGEGRLIFLSRSGQVGVYEQADDSWAVRALPGVHSGNLRFASAGDELFVLSGNRLLRYDRNLKPGDSQDLQIAPGGVIAHSTAGLSVVAANPSGHGVALWNRTKENLAGTMQSRGASRPPVGFNPANVVLAKLDAGELLLVDGRGAAARYSPATGDWRTVRDAVANEALWGWLTTGGAIELLLSANGDRGTHVVPIESVGGSDFEVSSPPWQLADHFAAKANAHGSDAEIEGEKLASLAFERAELDRLESRTAQEIRVYRKLIVELRGTAPAERETIECTEFYIGGLEANRNATSASLAENASRTRAAEGRQGIARQNEKLARERERHFRMPTQRPSNGVVLRALGVTIERSPSGISYRFQTATGKDFALHPAANGFVEDSPSSLALDNDGALWGATETGVVRFTKARVLGREGLVPALAAGMPGIRSIQRASDGLVRAELANGHVFISADGDRVASSLRPQRPQLAELKFGTYSLQWWARDSAGYSARWVSSAGLPLPPSVWGSRDGKFAWQCANDLAVLGRDRLVIATEAGLLVRKIADGMFVGLHAHPGARFATVPFTDRVIAKIGSRHFRVDEKSGEPVATQAEDFVGSLNQGAWIWRAEAPFAIPPVVSIKSTTRGQHARQWVHTNEGWRFADDCVNWLLRRTEPRAVWLATDDGLWPFDPNRGRGKVAESLGSAIAAPPGNAMQAQFENAAVRVVQRAGQLTFTLLDGGNPPTLFRGGTFFFDSQSGLASSTGMLWSLVPGRCVIGRNAATPAKVVVCVALPNALSDPAMLALTLAPEGPCLRDVRPGHASERWWFELVPNGAPRWTLLPQRPNVPNTIGWQRMPGKTERWQPVVFTTTTTATPVNSWWASDRFAWDKARSVAALDGANIVIASIAGPWKAPAAGKFPVEQFWNRPEIIRTAHARRGSTIFGVALQAKSGATFTIESMKNVLSPTVGVPLAESRLRWDRRSGTIDHAIPFEHLGLSEHWLPQTWEGSEGGVLESGIADLLAAELIRDGTFVFDRADGACPLAVAGHWLTWRKYDSTSRLARNVAIRSARTGQMRLVLADEWREPLPVREVRSLDAGRTVIALLNSNDSPKFAAALASEIRPDWKVTAAGGCERAFQTGESVILDISTLSWDKIPVYPWTPDRDGAEAFVISHSVLGYYEPFQEMPAGLSFAFDDWRSIASREQPGGREIAIGTAAGVWIGTLAPTPVATFNKVNGRFFCAQSTDKVSVLAPVRRVRFSPTEGWTVTSSVGARLLLSPVDANTLSLWKPAPMPKSPEQVCIAEGGVMVDGVLRVRSSDGWYRNRRSLKDPIDVIRGHRKDEYWVATESPGGLFKLTYP